MRIFVANAILLTALVFGAQSQTTKDPKVEQETIKIWRSGSQPSRQGPAENFTGVSPRRSTFSSRTLRLERRAPSSRSSQVRAPRGTRTRSDKS